MRHMRHIPVAHKLESVLAESFFRQRCLGKGKTVRIATAVVCRDRPTGLDLRRSVTRVTHVPRVPHVARVQHTCAPAFQIACAVIRGSLLPASPWRDSEVFM